ncbi:MAG: ATP-binding cassette domain-containing protein [Candidatus Lokiarchaeota archaeon]|nr:ATP-binding cassette domain-containing protein [Candidatus Lokiarchaeota archaeon]MBD3341123.1 ATP-binding cassette domain-containing protein [Candidatus Lokiarchaeota archaeon]
MSKKKALRKEAEKEKTESENDEADEIMKQLQDKIVISAKNLIKDYEIGEFIVRAVDGVSLNIKTGEFIVIKGPSGAGKTTLLNLLGGLDKSNKGTIFIHAVKISDMEEESLATFRLLNSGFIFQNYNLISTLTAEENVLFPMRIAGVSLKKARDIASRLLEKVGLKERREHLPFQLSAGEQQRVAIARALANNPPIILADEPTANLDKKTSEFIRDLFKDLKEDNKTIIIATHDDYLIELADRIINFEDARIIKEHTEIE